MESLSDLLVSSLASGSLLALALAYLGGVITSATPCVYPMIPITISVLGSVDGQKENNNNDQLTSFFNAIIYAFGLATVYGLLGVIAAATGQMFGEISTHPIGYFLVANLCLLFGVWMMGWLPVGSFDIHARLVNSRLATFFPLKKIQSTRGRLLVIGAASGLVAGPCTAPVLASLLTYVASTGNVIYGGLLLFAFAFGLSTCLIVIGTFSGLITRLPRSGQWMQRIKISMAVIMLAAGEYFLIQMGMLLF